MRIYGRDQQGARATSALAAGSRADPPGSRRGRRQLAAPARNFEGKDGVHVGFLVDQLANLVPVPTLLALVADRSHAFAPSLNCTQSAAIFCGNRRDKLFGEILRTHGLKDREVTKRTTKPYCLMRAVGSVKATALLRPFSSSVRRVQMGHKDSRHT